jgi:pimeloyl-ACP methyl ester carboxylesterase
VLLLLIALAADTGAGFSVPVAPKESIHVIAAGEGPAVVLVPGFFGSAFTFRKVTPALNARGLRTLVIEPLGIGESSRPPHADYSLTAQARRIAAVLDTLGVRSAILVAHSSGGSISLRLAYQRPDLVDGVISIEGGPTESTVTSSFRSAMRFVPWIKWLGGLRLIRWKIRGMLMAASGDRSWVSDSVVSGYTAAAAANLDATLKVFLAMAASRERERLAPHLHQIKCPVDLLVGGAPHDGDVGSEEVRLLRRELPHFTLDSVPGAGHFLQEERPDAVVASILRLVLARSSAEVTDENRAGR